MTWIVTPLSNLVPIADYTTSGTSKMSSTYYTLSGTSMAAPVVSGAAALLLQQNPLLTPDPVKATLMLTASKTFPQYSSYIDPSTGISYTSQISSASICRRRFQAETVFRSTRLKLRTPTMPYSKQLKTRRFFERCRS